MTEKQFLKKNLKLRLREAKRDVRDGVKLLKELRAAKASKVWRLAVRRLLAQARRRVKSLTRTLAEARA